MALRKGGGRVFDDIRIWSCPQMKLIQSEKSIAKHFKHFSQFLDLENMVYLKSRIFDLQMHMRFILAWIISSLPTVRWINSCKKDRFILKYYFIYKECNRNLMTILTWKEQCGRGARLCSSNSTFRRIWHCESILISWFFFRMSQCKGISFENLHFHQSWSRVSRASIITNGQQSMEKSNWKSQYCLINDVHIFQCFFRS
jgi:hypothetical protein